MELSITEKVTKTIALNMIVKNESHIIEKTLQNLCDYISFDYWVICDTGSTDDTQDIIKAFFKSKHIPGELHQCEWKDFGTNRTEALEKAFDKTDYLLIFDADDSIHGEFHLPTLWNFDSYCLKFGNPANDSVYKRVLLINNRKKYAFRGVLHEFIIGLTKDLTETTINGDYYLVSGREGARSKNPNKYLDDAKVLEQGFHDEEDKSIKNRYAFYCGQSYKDAGKIDTAIMWFKKSLELPLWVQEKYYSCYQLGYLYQQKGEPEKAIHYWLKTSQYDSQRIEGIVAACNKYKEIGMNDMAVALYKYYENYADWSHNLHEKLFVDTNKYRQELEYHCSIAAGYTQQKQYGYECCKKIILLQGQSASIVNCTISNLRYYKEFLRKDEDSLAFFYVLDSLFGRLKEDPENTIIWKILFDNNRKKCTQKPCLLKTPQNHSKPFIFLSFTTCKRWDLFQQTMNSLLNHWQDYAKIDYWFCVDDNSSDQDRTSMRTAYPWMDYYMKSPEEKGHRASMNIIWEKLNELKPTYWIHLEDDFLFHRKYNYIEKSIECLQTFKEKNIKQVLFNRGYGETIKDYSIMSYIPLNDDFSLHDHKQGHFSTRNCHYWPHYSFRPSLVEVDAILRLGNFDSPNQFFEMDYANKWNNAGYQSAFLNLITNRHIGRLTSERHNKNLPNAYELNEENQFTKKSYPIKIINLERRADRKKGTMEKLEKGELHNYSFIKARDGKQIRVTTELKKIFTGNDFGNHRGVIGCALSHYEIWKQLVWDGDYDFYLIMEDDFTLRDDFKESLEMLQKEMCEKEIIFFGYHMFEEEREKVKEIYNHSNNNIKVAKLNQSLFVGGTHCYSINTKGAQKMLDYIEKNGIKHGIDFVMGKLNGDMCYETQPQLSFAPWNEEDVKIDSDIRQDNIGLQLVSPFIKIINLERRTDRKRKMTKTLEANNIAHYEFFNAIDGLTLPPTEKMKTLFEENDFGSNKGTIGCAMSHYTLWQQLLEDEDNEFYLILEDDIELCDDFEERLNNVMSSEQKDLILLGYSMFDKERLKVKELYDSSNNDITLEKLNKDLYIGGFFSYLITTAGAQKLVDYIETNGIKHGIDYLIKVTDTIECFEARPQLIFATWNEKGRLIDSDVQNRCNPMCFPTYEYVFLSRLDQIGKDLYYHKESVDACKMRAEKDTNCVGFNTLGFFKNEIDDLTPSPYFGKEDGIYIKKEHYEVYQMKQKKNANDNLEPHTIQQIYKKDSHILNDVFIETGSFEGDGIQAALNLGFKEIHSIELSDKYFNICKVRFKDYPQVHLHLGDSGTLLGDILSKINTGVTFWLDGHYSSMDTACAEKYCSPVQQELQFIKQYNHPKHVILIDDMKDFTDKSIKWNLATHKKCGYIPKRDLEERLKEIHPNSKIYYFGPACISYNKMNQFHTIGDSHARGVSGWDSLESVNVWWGGPILCFSFGRDKLKKINIKKIGVREGDAVCFCLGEIDCRCHISKFITEKLSYEKIITNIATEYFKAIKENELLYNNIDIFVNSITPPASNINCGGNREFPFLGSDKLRAQITMYFNKKIEELCLQYNYVFINSYQYYCNKIKLLNKHYSDGHVHIKDGRFIKKAVLQAISKNKKILKNISKWGKCISKNLLADNNINYKRVKMLCNWCSSEELCRQWSTMCEEGFHWKDIELTSEDENIDYYVIINKPQEGAKYNPKKTIIFQMEPWIYNATKNWGVHTWGKWSIPDEKKFLYVGRHKNDLNNVQWEIKVPDIIPENRKNKALIFLSAKKHDWGHKKRIEFLKKLETWQKEEEGREPLIDIYGRENYHTLSNYIGPVDTQSESKHPLGGKENHFINYKYCFAVENNSERNYATEKIWEPILCECLTFYWGCPGLEKHINEKAFVRLDITDFEGSLATIQQAIKEDWWSQRIDIIRQEKQKILDELGFFPRLRKIIKDGKKK